MLTVQSSSGLYFAVQYDGTNGPAIAAALRAVDYGSSAGVISFKAFIMRTGGLLTSGHQFTVPLGYWVVWADEGNPYVIAPPLTTAQFEQQYQVAASAAEVAALSAQVTALGVQVGTLTTSVAALGTDVVALDLRVDSLEVTMGAVVVTVNLHTTQIATLNTNVGTLTTDLATTNTNVANLDTAVHNIDAAWITSGILPPARLSGTIAENATIVLYNRPTLVTPGTALDCWRWLYNGVRTVYGNEYNLLRVRGVAEDQVPARFMSNAARDGLATAILQASLSDAASHLFQVLGNGDIQSAGGLSMLPTAPVAVTFNAVAGTANAATISDGVSTGAPYAVATTLQASDNRVFLDGAVANPTGVTVNAQVTLFTITAAHRPAAWTQRAGRTSSGLAARITIKPDGTVVLDQALVAGASIALDGVNWRKS